MMSEKASLSKAHCWTQADHVGSSKPTSVLPGKSTLQRIRNCSPSDSVWIVSFLAGHTEKEVWEGGIILVVELTVLLINGGVPTMVLVLSADIGGGVGITVTVNVDKPAAVETTLNGS